MNPPSFTIELESETVAVGDEVIGRLSTPAPGRADPAATLPVELLWRTSGRCQSEEKIVASQLVPTDAALEAAFRLQIPAAGPMTYHGRTFSIDWCVRIAAEPVVERSLTVVAAVRKSDVP